MHASGDLDLEEMLGNDILYVREMYVDHSFRGVGLGLFMLNAADKVINSRTSITVLKPTPLQFLPHWERPFEPDTTLTLRTPGDGVLPHYLEPPPPPVPVPATDTAEAVTAIDATVAEADADAKYEQNEHGKRSHSSSEATTSEIARPNPQQRELRRRSAAYKLERYFGR